MRCLKCKQQLPKAANYCSACGAPAPATASLEIGTSKETPEAQDTTVAVKETARTALGMFKSGLKTDLGKSMATGAALGAVIAVPIPFVGPILGAAVGATVGAYRKLT
jgi:predicted amidophosphoribosyltransferase